MFLEVQIKILHSDKTLLIAWWGLSLYTQEKLRINEQEYAKRSPAKNVAHMRNYSQPKVQQQAPTYWFCNMGILSH